MAIRPEIQKLIDRGRVEISEIEHLHCTQEEAAALIPALTNYSLARRLDRTLINLHLADPPTTELDADLWRLYWAADSARKHLERNLRDAPLADLIDAALAKVPAPAMPPARYRDALCVLAAEAAKRLRNPHAHNAVPPKGEGGEK
jgi:hypothetical protein